MPVARASHASVIIHSCVSGDLSGLMGHGRARPAMLHNTVRVIGVPMDLGAGRRGVDMGPSAIRAAGLHARIKDLGYKVQDAGNVFTAEPEERKPKDPRLKYVDEVLAACKDLVSCVLKSACASNHSSPRRRDERASPACVPMAM